MSQVEQKKPHGSAAPNRLAKETSPYLLQHAYNPVDWYTWGPEALAKSRAENKPILLSIGYAACHWCHVMEHESFEDDSTAQLMNQRFVNIKVDREERTDLDDIYMKAVQMMTGHGGWPMTVFLTPELKPFFGGTYFPPTDRHGMPSFKKVLNGVSQAWEDQREQVEASSNELAEYLRVFDKAGQSDSELDSSIIEGAISKVLAYSDREWGGLGGAPKFPHSTVLDLAMRFAVNTSADEDRRTECEELVSLSLDKMAYGGMHDQIGGGFARYSVDRQWLVPHFEKMLYDNAMLARTYLDGFVQTGRSYWAQVARDTLDFVLRELTTTEGAFYSSLDADSEGEEGKFYVWTPEQTIAVLGEEDGRWLNRVYGVMPGGNFEGDTTVLHLTDAPEKLAFGFGIMLDTFWSKLEPLKQKLLAERETRVRPGRDEKVLTSWNGLMISAFAKGYAVLKEDRYLQAARKAAQFVLKNLYRDGRLLRTWGKGQAKLNGYLDDYAFIIHALLDLAEVDPDNKWFSTARSLMDTALKHFWDHDDGGFFYTSDDHEELVTRPKNYFDGSTPSGTSVIAGDLLRLAALTGRQDYTDKAENVIKLYAPHISKMPDQFSNLLCALDRLLSSSTEIALVANTKKDTSRDLVWAVHSVYLPNKAMLVVGSDEKNIDSPLLENRGLIDGKAAIYICHDYTCDKPITDPTEVAKALSK